MAKRSGVDFVALASPVTAGAYEIRKPRIAMLQRYGGGNMDEGWTRWLFDQHDVPYITIVDSTVKAGRLRDQFDVVLVPVNGAVVSFPNRRPASPLPVALDPGQAAIAADLLGARMAIPIHAEGYEIEGIYEPVVDAAERFTAAAAERGIPARMLEPGEALEIEVPAGRG